MIDHEPHLSAPFDRFDRHVQNVGVDQAVRLSYTAEVSRLLDDGVSAVTIWRGREGLTRRALATAAGISQSCPVEIESGKKPGSLAGTAAIAKTLRIPIEHLAQGVSGEAAAGIGARTPLSGTARLPCGTCAGATVDAADHVRDRHALGVDDCATVRPVGGPSDLQAEPCA